ncbi:hypothetical protein HD554DRAFT_1732921 [Boletus coccyginus]|nr:hypothetical protein HD554DRAFT_1732921 [Boletus coccyginus]
MARRVVVSSALPFTPLQKMPHKASRSVNLVDDDDDALSQYSKAPDSDDRELEVYAKAVAEFKVTWQKQKRDKERRFLKAAQAELDQHVNRKQREVQGIMKEMEETYQEFLLNYAVIEDKKREVILKIAETQKALVALSVRKHQEMVELASDLEESQLEGIKQIEQTCHDFAGMTDAFMKV